MKRILFTAIAGLIITAAGGTASAAVLATLTFTQPTATVNSTDIIPIYVTLAIDPLSSDPLITDAFGNVTSLLAADIDANLLPGVAAIPGSSADATRSFTNVGLGCATSTFFSGCGGSPYAFDFASDFIAIKNLNLQPGDSATFLFGTLTPAGGGAPNGTYSLSYVNFVIEVVDDTRSDTLRDPLSSGSLLLADVIIAGTTSDFTRTVVGADVPEPASYGLLLGGIAALAIARRRKPLLRK